MGGGSAQINPHYRVAPFDALRAALPETCRSLTNSAPTTAVSGALSGEVEIEYFRGREFDGPADPRREERARASSCSSASRRPSSR